jgi:hypothetical protein
LTRALRGAQQRIWLKLSRLGIGRGRHIYTTAEHATIGKKQTRKFT